MSAVGSVFRARSARIGGVRRSVLVALATGLALAGCAGDGGAPGSPTGAARPGELPVICVAGAGASRCGLGSGRWHYDYPSNRCLPTSPGACPGRRLFESLEACRKQCGAAP